MAGKKTMAMNHVLNGIPYRLNGIPFINEYQVVYTGSFFVWIMDWVELKEMYVELLYYIFT